MVSGCGRRGRAAAESVAECEYYYYEAEKPHREHVGEPPNLEKGRERPLRSLAETVRLGRVTLLKHLGAGAHPLVVPDVVAVHIVHDLPERPGEEGAARVHPVAGDVGHAVVEARPTLPEEHDDEQHPRKLREGISEAFPVHVSFPLVSPLMAANFVCQ